MSEVDYVCAFKLSNGEEIVAYVVEENGDGWMIKLVKKFIQVPRWFIWYDTVLADWINCMPPEEEYFLEKKLVLWHGDPGEAVVFHWMMNLPDCDGSDE